MKVGNSTQPSTTNSDNTSSSNKETLDVSQKSEESKISGLLSSDTMDSLRAQVRELSEKLIFANETIALMDDHKQEVMKRQSLPTASAFSDDEDEEEKENDKESECSNSSEKMVGRMINKAQ